jgi:opacity protein-like surface antigen
VCCVAFASEAEENSATNRVLSFIPFVRNNPCAEPYSQLAASPPLQGTSDGDEGFPWRAMYGYCVAQSGRLSLHQDWVVSYLDSTPQGNAPGGDGVSFGTDFSFQWRHRLGASFTPYYELGGGIQYAVGTSFPAHGSRWMFTINAGAGFLFPLKPNLQLNTEIRYLHISNAGILAENAGYDAFHIVIGVRWLAGIG